MKKKVIISLIFLLILSSIAYADITTDCTNVVALYHFDGDVNDSSGNGNDGTIIGATYNPSGKVGGAYDFDGIDDGIDITGFPTLTNLTFSAWVNTKDLLTNPITGASDGIFRYVKIESSYFLIHDGGGWKEVAGWTKDVWHHVVFTFEGATKNLTMYVNSVQGYKGVGINYINGVLMTIGHDDNPYYFNGSIDEVIIYNKALSQTEITELYNAGTAGTAVSCGAPCVPDCTGLSCGPDPVCGQSCGTCNATSSCVSGVCEAVSSNCGNVIIDSGEVCDETNLFPYTSDCSTYLDFTGGILACASDCLSFDISSCTNSTPVTCVDNDNDGHNQSAIGCGVADCDDTVYDVNNDCSGGTIHNAVSCSQTDVQAKIDIAVDGDTILVPAGNCVWVSEVEITKPLKIIGEGSNKTILTASGGMLNGFFWVHGFTSNESVRISGFTFNMVDLTPAYGILIGTHDISISNLRIDNNIFNQGNTQILIGGSKGVLDNNYFYNGIKAISFTAGTRAQADASWDDMSAGTRDALFIEDNYFIDDVNYLAGHSQEKIGTYNGGKLVIRYNERDADEWPLAVTAGFLVETHGSAAAGGATGYWQNNPSCRRGQSVVEVYHNIVHGKRIDFLTVLRGSANLVYNNTITSQIYIPRIDLREEEYSDSSNWNPLRTEWPAEDQVHNTFIWDNTINGVPFDATNIVTNPNIVENRDYFLYEPQATGGMEIFTGANGASSSYPTDGNVYPTLGTMEFISTGPNAYYPYIPFEYPHPLRGETPTPTCNDNDGDGYGNPASNDCTYPELDCDDRPNGEDGLPSTPDDGTNINPGKDEICNQIDEDCDGSLQCHDADSDGSGCIVDTELDAFVQRWFVSSQDVSMSQLISAIRVWKQGCN